MARPTNTVSCCDKSGALFVPSNQKYTHSGPQPNSPGEWGKACKGVGSYNLWTKVVILSLTIRPCEGTKATYEGWGCASFVRLGPL